MDVVAARLQQCLRAALDTADRRVAAEREVGDRGLVGQVDAVACDADNGLGEDDANFDRAGDRPGESLIVDPDLFFTMPMPMPMPMPRSIRTS